MVADFFPVYIYALLVFIVTLVVMALSAIFPARLGESAKYLPYESGMRTETHLLQKRFPLRHYLVAIIFLVFDVEVVFMFPWAVVAKEIGPFAFYEMAFFILTLLVGFAYVWRKRGLQWE